MNPPMRTAAMALVALIAWLGAGSPAWAHKPSDAYLTLQVEGHAVDQRFDVALRDLDRELVLDANDDGALTWGEVRTRWSEIEQLAAHGVQVTADGQPCRIESRAAPQLDGHSDGQYAVLVQRFACAAPVRHLGVSYTLFQRSDATHRGIVRIVAGPTALAAVLVPGAPEADFALNGGGGSASFFGFLAEGVHHILVGIDHILFLLALLLPAVLVRSREGWRAAPAIKPVLLDVLRVVTAFTVAHSITLALAVFDVISPPSRWVESIIALSVILAALNNLRPIVGRQRWAITFAFGLVHGFGFAGALKDLGLGAGSLVAPLVGFNLGVELGQLGIVALFVPLAWILRPSTAYRRGALQFGSVAIALVATVWLAERALNLSVFGIA